MGVNQAMGLVDFDGGTEMGVKMWQCSWGGCCEWYGSRQVEVLGRWWQCICRQ